MIPVYIPSMGRSNALFNSIGTLNFMRDVSLVVPPDEVEKYEAAIGTRGRKDVKILSCEEKGIAKVRHWIGKRAAEFGEKKFLMCDDDLNFGVRIDDTKYNLRPQTPEDTKAMLAWTNHALDKYAHVSVSPRDVNAGTPAVASGPPPLVMENKRTLRYLAYRTKDFLSVEHGRVEVMEDFDVNLQLIRKGLPNALAYWWTNDQRQTGSPGGCASYRSKEVHEASAKKLAALHDPFVKLRMKKNTGQVVKSARDMQERLEVTIYWVKAFASTQ